MEQQTEFIPYEQALELRQLGFDNLPLYYYNSFGYLTPFISFVSNVTPNNQSLFEGVCYAPLYQQAFRWFREKYNLMYTIKEVWEEDTEYYVVEITTHNRVDDFLQECTYEEAELACLKKLIEIVKNK
jgi:hypothetical protein